MLLTVDQAVEAARAGTAVLKIHGGSSTITCKKVKDKVTFQPSFPLDAKPLDEQKFKSIFTHNRFLIQDAKESK